MKDCKW